ncbi:MAG: hypothetical protein ABI778_11465, partial [Ignavibacteriota bacterium]
MVKTFGWLVLAGAITAAPLYGQTGRMIADSTDSINDLTDPSITGNEIFNNSLDENTLLEQLQFNSDEYDRILALREPKKYFLLRSRVVVDPNASALPEYQSGYYRGSAIKTMTRLEVQGRDVVVALVEAKDAGEPLYFDHLTGCFAITHPLEIVGGLNLTKLVVGDYSLSYGNGLLFSNSYLQLSSRSVNLDPSPLPAGIAPYISSSSFRFFRGASAEITSGDLSISAFFSDRMIDAATDSSRHLITSLPST